MDLEEVKKTDIWCLYEKGLNYMRLMNIFTDTDKNYRFYNGNQWEGAKIDGIEQAQYNFIEKIINHKVAVINANSYAINFGSDNFEKRFRKQAEETCVLLNRKARKVWEKDQLDNKIRDCTEDAAINDEAIIYVTYDEETQSPKNEVLSKNDVQYGNEQSSDIQNQPYIIISQRIPVLQAKIIARNNGVSENDINNIIGDNNVFEQAGEPAKYEKDEMCTLVTKMWKEKKQVWYAQSVKFVDIKEATNTKLTLYPIAHMIWSNKRGSSRGEGEVRNLIPNQIELNKTLARVLLCVKQVSYPQKIADVSKISNPGALTQLGGLIKTNGQPVDDVNKIFGYVQPAQMSQDVNRLMSDLISITRELRDSSEAATGGVNPEDASGRAILAVQQASKEPMIKQLNNLKRLLEDVARIWLDMWTIYTPDGMILEKEITNPETSDKYIEMTKVPSTILSNLKGTVKIDITPKGSFDKYAQELSLENLLKAGFFSPQMIGQLEVYAKSLPEDATMPKQTLLDIIDDVKEEQRKIALINSQAQMEQQRAMQFIDADVDTQAQQIADIQLENQLENQINNDNQAQ